MTGQISHSLLLMAKYKEQIEDAICECEHVYRLSIDYNLLDQRLAEIIKAAKEEGLEEKAIWNLIHTVVPSYINYKNSKYSGKKAA